MWNPALFHRKLFWILHSIENLFSIIYCLLENIFWDDRTFHVNKVYVFLQYHLIIILIFKQFVFVFCVKQICLCMCKPVKLFRLFNIHTNTIGHVYYNNHDYNLEWPRLGDDHLSTSRKFFNLALGWMTGDRHYSDYPSHNLDYLITRWVC